MRVAWNRRLEVALGDAPLLSRTRVHHSFFQVGAFAQDLLLEVVGESVSDHLRQDTAPIRADQCCRLTLPITGRRRGRNPLAEARVDRRVRRHALDGRVATTA